MSLRNAREIAKGTFQEFGQDDTMTLAAALAYYAIFSIAPLLVIIVGIAGLVFGEASAKHQVAQQLQGVVGAKSASVVESMMASQTKTGSLIATITGAVVLVLGATGIFNQLKSSLNRIFQVKPRSDRGIFGLVLDRVLSLAIVLVIGLLLLVSMLLTTLISRFYGLITQQIHLPGFVAQVVNLLVSWCVITVLFAVIFKLLPDARPRWRETWVGAVTTALLFLIGEYLLSLYLSRQGASSSYGAAGSVVLLLMWIYYSSVILFLGAEFTHVYARQRGDPIPPGKFAEPLGGT